MKKGFIYFIFLVYLLISCDEGWIDKPKKLIPEDKMIEILVDIHLSNSLYATRSFTEIDSVKLSSKDYYYSVLELHNVTDTVFEKSLLYYANFAKDYEKMYAKVTDKLNLMKQEYSNENDEPVNIGNAPRH